MTKLVKKFQWMELDFDGKLDRVTYCSTHRGANHCFYFDDQYDSVEEAERELENFLKLKTGIYGGYQHPKYTLVTVYGYDDNQDERSV